ESICVGLGGKVSRFAPLPALPSKVVVAPAAGAAEEVGIPGIAGMVVTPTAGPGMASTAPVQGSIGTLKQIVRGTRYVWITGVRVSTIRGTRTVSSMGTILQTCTGTCSTCSSMTILQVVTGTWRTISSATILQVVTGT